MRHASKPILFILILACLGVLGRLWVRFEPKRLSITFFDVHQGDAALIKFPGGGVWGVDAGIGSRRWDIGSRVLFPELARMGILTLDVFLLSHPDRDHIGGLSGLLQNIHVDEIWLNESFVNRRIPLLAHSLLIAKSKGTRVRGWRFPAKFDYSGVNIELRGEGRGTRNNQSLVLLLDYHGCRTLFTGDIGKEVELKLPFRDLTVLKVAHHGSRTSTAEVFIAKTRPRYGVISSGKGNRYGHPHESSIEVLRAAAVQVLRTDFHGFVQFDFFEEGRFVCQSSIGRCGEGNCLSLDP